MERVEVGWGGVRDERDGTRLDFVGERCVLREAQGQRERDDLDALECSSYNRGKRLGQEMPQMER